MNVDHIALPLANRLAHDYQQGMESAVSFFSYQPYQSESYRERLAWLRGRIFSHRDKLAEGLYTYNREIGNHEEALKRVEALKKPDTYVVIGGQQAGVLTGPLYTINKAIHLIQAAQKLSQELQVEVIPVFWIAGEDHDLDEIDHVFWVSEKERRLHKERIKLTKKGRFSASDVTLEASDVEALLQAFYEGHPETEHTSQIRKMLHDTASSSKTPVEWFARLLAQLFGKHGLVLVESSSAYIRELEKPVFQKVIEKNEQIAQLLTDAAKRIEAAGYPLQLQVEEHQANLFLYEGGERLLLERFGERFVNRRCTYSREELLQLAEDAPQRFSANVVTRGLMQEHLFPTLAFIGGPGEIAYWAYYREIFAALDMQMPIVLPRMSITLLEGALERLLAGFELDLAQVLGQEESWKEAKMRTREQQPLDERFAHVRDALLDLYRPLVEDVVQLDSGMRGIADKNLSNLLGQVDFLQKRLIRSLQERDDTDLRRIWRLEANLLPEGGLQERKISFFSFANKYGLALVDRLVQAPFTQDGQHQIFHL